MLSHYLPGYCRLLIIGGEPERFINLATQRNINIWNIRDLDHGVLSVEISLGSVKAVRYVAQATGCSLEIVEKRGLPITLRGFRRHKAFVFGAAFALLLLFFFSQSIVRVEIETEGALTDAEKANILAISAEHQIKPYSFAWNIDWQAAAEDILRQTDGFSWVGYEKEGVLVRILLVEKTVSVKEDDANGNIVAKADGVIREILVYKGQKKVEVNEAVQEGDILISGFVEPAEQGTGKSYSVHPEGLVKGAVWYEATASCDLNELKPLATGETRDYIALYWQEREYLLWGTKENDFSDYEEESSVFLLGQLRLEIMGREEMEVKESGYSKEEAKEIAIGRAKAAVVTEITPGAKVVKEEVFPVFEDENTVTLRLVVETYEDMGTFIADGAENGTGQAP